MDYCSIRLSKLTVRTNFLRERRGWAITILCWNPWMFYHLCKNVQKKNKFKRLRSNWKLVIVGVQVSHGSPFPLSLYLILKMWFVRNISLASFSALCSLLKKVLNWWTGACILLKSNLVFSFDWKLSTYLG